MVFPCFLSTFCCVTALLCGRQWKDSWWLKILQILFVATFTSKNILLQFSPIALFYNLVYKGAFMWREKNSFDFLCFSDISRNNGKTKWSVFVSNTEDFEFLWKGMTAVTLYRRKQRSSEHGILLLQNSP